MIKIERIGQDLRFELPKVRAATRRAILQLPMTVAALYARTALVDEIRHRLAKDPTGALARSVQTRWLVEPGSGTLSTAVAGSKLVYAEIQDQGGEIRPRLGKYLSIPVDLPPSMRGKYPRDWPRGALILMRSKRGNPLLVEKQSMRIRYVLRRRVRLRGTRYVAAAFARMQAPAEAFVTQTLQATIDRNGGRGA
jgi:hypothetical protein